MKQTKTWEITKRFDFCYSHRVWAQKLDVGLSCGAKSKCRYLHGHNGEVEITLTGNNLNDQGMILDFVELNFFKKFLDETVDHKFIIHKDDPLFTRLIPECGYNEPGFLFHREGFSTVDVKNLPQEIKSKPELVELYESYVIVDFIPTSESISQWFYEIISNTLKDFKIKVKSVKFFETPKSNSNYIGG